MSQDKKLEIIHHGSALQNGSQVYRLKDLLPLKEIFQRNLRIKNATAESCGVIHLALSDGSSRDVVIPIQSNNSTELAAGPADLLICNAGQILTFNDSGIGLNQNGAITCRQGRIIAVLKENPSGQGIELLPDAQIIDAGGGVVAPGLIDPHTHPVFAGERCLEFSMKAAGKTYLEIHQAGGGILSTVRATRTASFEELARVCRRNLTMLLKWGVTTCEAKSGYALDVEGELRLLEVLQTVGDCHPMEIEPTFLGAHTIPPEFKQNRAEYVALVCEAMIPRVAREHLARFCDAYCEDGAFTIDEVTKIFNAAQSAGLALRLHAEQFTDQGGAALAAKFSAASVDHLEAISVSNIQALGQSPTTAVLLPGASLACRCPWPPARALLDAGAHVALGTDLNPGSSMTSSLPLMMSLACMQMKMTCEEVWRAVTCEAAHSLGRNDIGRILPGGQADLVVFDAPDYRYIPYHYADNHARVVIKRGQVIINSLPID